MHAEADTLHRLAPAADWAAEGHPQVCHRYQQRQLHGADPGSAERSVELWAATLACLPADRRPVAPVLRDEAATEWNIGAAWYAEVYRMLAGSGLTGLGVVGLRVGQEAVSMSATTPVTGRCDCKLDLQREAGVANPKK